MRNSFYTWIDIPIEIIYQVSNNQLRIERIEVPNVIEYAYNHYKETIEQECWEDFDRGQ